MHSHGSPLSQAWLELSNGHMHWLEQNTCTIGRGANNSLVLDLPGISRSHAMLQPGSGGGYQLADLRSTNGTYLNGLRVEQLAALHDGDTIELGGVALTYRCQQSPGQAVAVDVTSVQIYAGACWILLLDLIGHTTHTHQVGAEAANADFKRWLELIRPVLLNAGGTINAYLGDAVLAYWREDRQPANKVSTALHTLAQLQDVSPRPYRIILHHARIRISGGLLGEVLSGEEVIFAFRIEKAVKTLGSTCVLTEPAVQSLQLTDAVRHLGHHPVRDYPGDHPFYAFKSLAEKPDQPRDDPPAATRHR